MSEIRRCALITRFADERVSESARMLTENLLARGLEVLAPEEERNRLDLEGVQFVDDDTLAQDADLVIAIGGDGTLLYAARLVAPGEFLMTCSCSGAMTQSGTFGDMVALAVEGTGRRLTWLRRAGASPCHVTSPHYPEGTYLSNYTAVLN